MDREQDSGCVVKLRGLPWSTTVEEIVDFFRESKVAGGKAGVHMTTSREGRPSGEAFVEFEDEEDVIKACKRDRDHMGNRYIEVFKVNRAEMDWVVKRNGHTPCISEDGCVRLRGLPFGCSKEEIAQFFTGLEIVPNGITLLTDYSGRSTGEAYVQFVNKDVAEKALQKHRERIGHRYIEIFRSSLTEISSALGAPNRRMGGGGGGGGGGSMSYGSRPAPYDRGDRYGGVNRYSSNTNRSRNYKGSSGFSGNEYSSYENSWNNSSNGGGGGGGGYGGRNTGMKSYGGSNWNGDRNSGGVHCVHMRGLPFKASTQDVADFFKPLVPTSINLLMDNTGRASGEADVDFECHEDAVKAMSKDKGHMEHRYIELFLNSSPGL